MRRRRGRFVIDCVEVRYALVRRCGFTRGGDRWGKGEGVMREIRHRVQSCQIVACILPLVSGRSRRSRHLSHSPLTSSRSLAPIAQTKELSWRRHFSAILIVNPATAASNISSRGDDFHEEYPRTRELFRDRGAALAAMMGVSGE